MTVLWGETLGSWSIAPTIYSNPWGVKRNHLPNGSCPFSFSELTVDLRHMSLKGSSGPFSVQTCGQVTYSIDLCNCVFCYMNIHYMYCNMVSYLLNLQKLKLVVAVPPHNSYPIGKRILHSATGLCRQSGGSFSADNHCMLYTHLTIGKFLGQLNLDLVNW